MLTDYLLFILQALAVLAVAAVALLFIHFLLCIIAGGEDDFDAATSQTETLTAPRAAEGGRMSVLINMEMPTNCWEDDCPCLNKQYGFCQADDDKGFVYSNKPEWCPLVPVSPHGALMDRDEFFAACPELVDGYKRITDGLVVIPASEEGE